MITWYILGPLGAGLGPFIEGWASHLKQQQWYNNWGLVSNMNGTNRADVKPGTKVMIVLKKDQRSGKLTEGIVKDILTKSPTHHHGVKVRLESGEIGRVKEILGQGNNRR